ncbi:MAG TPA: mandelate racemase/muconate lactonizing enzyme family protein [Thermoguttaceae bacterium]|nr:mandelate racemase/muconate lactonizing enzyme family protein [Thermoguttaceae bacterium]
MKITDLEFHLVQRTHAESNGPKTPLLVRLSASHHEGWGEASVTWREDEPAARRNALLDVLVGRSMFDVEELLALDELREPSLRSAVEMACWDLIGRVVSQPVCNLLGGIFRRRVPLTIRIPSGPVPRVIQWSRELAGQGFHAQVIVASGRPEDDVRTLTAIRQNLGDHIPLRLDGQGRYDLETARDLCAELEYANLECFFDPLLVMELHELASLARQVNVPLGACRMLRGVADVFVLARLGAIPMAMIDVQHVGGLTAARKCAAVAEAAGLSASLSCSSWSGLGIAAMVQLAAATPALRTAHACDYHQLNHELLPDWPEVADGMVTVPQSPGLGVSPDRAKIERLRTG